MKSYDMSEHTSRIPNVQFLTPEEEQAYGSNRRLELSLRSENRRLRKVIDEKNRQLQSFAEECNRKMQDLIAKYRQYDEQRKSYYARFEEEYDDMKECFDNFNEEIQRVAVEEMGGEDDRKMLLRLYQNWYAYKKSASYLRDRLASGRNAVKGIQKDIEKIRILIGQEWNLHTIEAVADRSQVLQQHLDTLKGILKT